MRMAHIYFFGRCKHCSEMFEPEVHEEHVKACKEAKEAAEPISKNGDGPNEVNLTSDVEEEDDLTAKISLKAMKAAGAQWASFKSLATYWKRVTASTSTVPTDHLAADGLRTNFNFRDDDLADGNWPCPMAYSTSPFYPTGAQEVEGNEVYGMVAWTTPFFDEGVCVMYGVCVIVRCGSCCVCVCVLSLFAAAPPASNVGSSGRSPYRH